ncbi:MAG: hypothetical protein JSW28_07500 [Thermoplasmata archaeon]|nr:MAG: hypothetical protein JSW28_07500 [Thermoplasmata archaeon]
MEGFEVIVAMVTVLSAVLFAISLLAFFRERSWRLMIISIVLAFFLLKGIVLSVAILLTSYEDTSDLLTIIVLLDAVILLFLFFTGFRGAATEKKTDVKKEKTEETKT